MRKLACLSVVTVSMRLEGGMTDSGTSPESRLNGPESWQDSCDLVGSRFVFPSVRELYDTNVTPNGLFEGKNCLHPAKSQSGSCRFVHLFCDSFGKSSDES